MITATAHNWIGRSECAIDFENEFSTHYDKYGSVWQMCAFDKFCEKKFIDNLWQTYGIVQLLSQSKTVKRANKND